MYAVTSIWLVSRTRATLRSAEFGFLGVVVYTRVHTPRRCGLPFSAGVLVLLVFAWRPLRTSCWIVGTGFLSPFGLAAAPYSSSVRSSSVPPPAPPWRGVADPRGRACRPAHGPRPDRVDPEAARRAAAPLRPELDRTGVGARTSCPAKPGTRGKSTHRVGAGQNALSAGDSAVQPAPPAEPRSHEQRSHHRDHGQRNADGAADNPGRRESTAGEPAGREAYLPPAEESQPHRGRPHDRGQYRERARDQRSPAGLCTREPEARHQREHQDRADTGDEAADGLAGHRRRHAEVRHAE